MSEFEEDVEAFLRYYREVVRLRGVEHALREAVEDCVRVRHRYADCLHRVQEVEAERDALKSDLLELAGTVWTQWGLIVSDGRRVAGGLSTLEIAEQILRKHGRINERGRFAWEEEKA